MNPRRKAPVWLACLCGVLVADTLVRVSALGNRLDGRVVLRRAALENRAPGPAAAEQPLLAPRGLDLAGLRALRGLPGLGAVRALAIARARWELRADGRGPDGGPVPLGSLPGIGALTEERIRALAPDRLPVEPVSRVRVDLPPGWTEGVPAPRR